MNLDTRYLAKRRNHWHYMRRVPVDFHPLDPRDIIRISLKTRSLIIAKERRNAMERADNEYWSDLVGLFGRAQSEPDQFVHIINQRYKMSKLQAISLQLGVVEAQTMVTVMGEMLRQFGMAPTHISPHALPPARLTEAFELYCNKIAFRNLMHKSPNQKKRWHQSRNTSLKNFVGVVGNKYVSELTREDALKFYGWWSKRIVPQRGALGLGVSGGNRDLSALRIFYRDYHAYFGQEDKPNPFRLLSYKVPFMRDKRPSFEDSWIRSKFLKPHALSFLREEAKFILYTLIETGCRLSEVVNLSSSNIILSTDVPFIKICPSRKRELKSPAAIRDIPLVGVSLQAFKQYPDGFPSFKDDSQSVSQYLLKTLRQHGMMPSDRHVIYSFRHSFERRMLEAGLDYDLRCRLMGHATSRPNYGGGGSMRWRHEQLLKIVHPYSKELFD